MAYADELLDKVWEEYILGTLLFSFEIITICVGFDVLTAVVMKSTVFLDVTPCSSLKVTGILFGLFFDPEDRGDVFPRNFGWLSTDCTALYPRRPCSLLQSSLLTHTDHLSGKSRLRTPPLECWLKVQTKLSTNTQSFWKLNYGKHIPCCRVTLVVDRLLRKHTPVEI
jgi:hypothetical protein